MEAMRRNSKDDEERRLLQRLEQVPGAAEEEMLERFGRRVRSARKRARLTLEEASERAELSSKFFGDVERGARSPSFRSVLAMAKAVEVAPIVLFQFEREETDPGVLRERIGKIVAACDFERLREVDRVVRALVEV